MQDVVLIIGGRAITLAEVLAGAGALAGLLLVGLLMIAMRARREQAEAQAIAAERQRELDDKLEAMTRLHAEMTGRMQTMAEVFGSRQAELTRAIGDRFDSLRGTGAGCGGGGAAATSAPSTTMCADASNTSAHWPQRTHPPEMRS